MNKILYIPLLLLAGCSAKPVARTPQTAALLRNLSNLEGTMYGHQDDMAYGVGWRDDDNGSDVKSVSGDYPAVFGWELGGLELGRSENIDGINFDRLRQFIRDAYLMGCVNTFSWHPANPLTGGNAWDVSSDEVVRSILEGGEKNSEYRQWLKRIAEYISSLRTDDGTPIPVLFRPFHELTGSWFWWGREHCTVAEYVSLWQQTYDYITAHTPGNVLWVYSTDRIIGVDDYMERYPGDERVDVLGFDCYQFGDDGQAYIATVRNILGVVTWEGRDRGKPVVFSETGYEGIPDRYWWTATLMRALDGYNVAWVLTWRNAYDRPGHFYAPYPGQESAGDFVVFSESERILFRNDIPKMYE